MGKQTSSMMTVVPLRRTPPTVGKSPSRTRQKRACSSGSRVNSAGTASGSRRVTCSAARISRGSSDSWPVWNSQSSAAGAAPR